MIRPHISERNAAGRLSIRRILRTVGVVDIKMIRPLASFGSGLQTQLEAVNFPVGIRRAISADAHAPDMLILGVCQRSALRVEEVLCQLEGVHLIAHGVCHFAISRQPDCADRLDRKRHV